MYQKQFRSIRKANDDSCQTELFLDYFLITPVVSIMLFTILLYWSAMTLNKNILP